MKSIRLSLIVYFLVLLTVALGAVSWLSYRVAEESLRERQRDAQNRVAEQFVVHCRALEADLDRRILQQAHMLVSLSQSMAIHAEGQHFLFGVLGAEGMPGGYLNAMLLLHEGTSDKIAQEIYRSQPLSTHIDNADKFVADEDGTHAQEYFQTYRSNGSSLQRSESMGDQSFRLGETLRKKLTLHTEYYDDVELGNGVKVRRVTLKANVPGSGAMILPWPFNPRFVAAPNVFFPKGGAFVRPPQQNQKDRKSKGGSGALPIAPRRPAVFKSETPFIFIQYASDVSLAEAKIADARQNRDRQIAELAATIEWNLSELRERMFAIGIAALAALWLVGYLVIRLGLAPLSKMSEAVSQVSVKDFHLPLDTERLPDELKPIASRLVELLDHLQKAFAREKQAAADISHELRTPLAALMTTLEVGLKKTRTIEEYQEILDDCRNSGQHMYQLVERLLTLARLDAGVDLFRPVDADITEIALNCADLIRPLARARGITLRFHLPDPITTETDPNKLREVLTNLLHNAVEYNQPNGAIDLAIERINGNIRIEVRDTGIGIKPELMERLFERFYRADPSRHADTPHAGLGLAIVKSYVDLMGGTIRVESSEAGTAFIVELPYVASVHDFDTAVQAAPEFAQR